MKMTVIRSAKELVHPETQNALDEIKCIVKVQKCQARNVKCQAKISNAKPEAQNAKKKIQIASLILSSSIPH